VYRFQISKSSKSNRKQLVIFLLLFLLGIASGIAFIIFLNSYNKKEVINLTPGFELISSNQAITAMHKEASNWSEDIKLISCKGMTISLLTIQESKYKYTGTDSGKYYNWSCTFFSTAKKQTRELSYRDNKVEFQNPRKTRESTIQKYQKLDSPSDVSTLLDSTKIFEILADQEIDTNQYYYNMYLGDYQDNGFVWKIEERIKNEEEKTDLGKLNRILIVHPTTGELLITND